jgi:hypothetical protein
MAWEGTSMAAPLVTHGIAGLRAGLGGTPRCETLRAFAAHFADGDAEVDHDERHIGYGRLRESYDGVWSGGQHDVTLLYEVDMARHGLIALPAPYPVGVPDDVMVDLKYTICYTSQVQLGYAAEYTRAGLITTFRPHARKYALYATGTKKPVVLEKAVDIVADKQRIIRTYGRSGTKIGGHPLSHSGTTRQRWEGDQRAGGKWETLLRTHHRLRAKNLHAPRLDLEYLAREGSQLVTGTVAKLPVSILLTIRVPPAIDLYELARSQFRVLAELRPKVTVPAAAPIRVTGRP